MKVMESSPPPVPNPAPALAPAPARNAEVVDQEHLRLLVIFHYVLAGITGLFGSIPLLHVAMGLFFVLNPETLAEGNPQGAPPAWFGWIFVGVGGAMVLMGWTMALLTFFSGRFMAQRRRWLFSMVIAGIQCAFVPFGTVLGIFTLIVLQRDTVRRLYQRPES